MAEPLEKAFRLNGINNLVDYLKAARKLGVRDFKLEAERAYLGYDHDRWRLTLILDEQFANEVGGDGDD